MRYSMTHVYSTGTSHTPHTHCSYCDQVTNGGGWMLVATRGSTTNPTHPNDYGNDLTDPDVSRDNLYNREWSKLKFATLWVQLGIKSPAHDDGDRELPAFIITYMEIRKLA